MKLNDLTDVSLTEMVDADSEVKRIAAHWKEQGKGMSKDDLINAIGNDLEQLEYSPEDVEKLVPRILKMVTG